MILLHSEKSPLSTLTGEMISLSSILAMKGEWSGIIFPPGRVILGYSKNHGCG
jgi:hypothetical protein